MATQTDLWGEIQTQNLRTPVTILKEQAALLGPKTQNIVEAKVVTQPSNDRFLHAFNLVVPALDFYTYQLFYVVHSIDLYPVQTNDGDRLESEDQFTGWLAKVLSSPKTKRTIESLLAQAGS